MPKALSIEEQLTKQVAQFKTKWLLEKETNNQLKLTIRQLIRRNKRYCSNCEKEYDLGTMKLNCVDCKSPLIPLKIDNIESNTELEST